MNRRGGRERDLREAGGVLRPLAGRHRNKEESSARLEWDEKVECGTSDKNRRRERRRAKERG
jgi:hypothetical protein